MRSITTVIPQEIINQNKIKYAYDFSEGNKSLEKCLLMLWDNGFETIGCCGGHNGHKSYIGFKLDDKAIRLLSNIKKQDVKITFVSLFNEENQKINFTIKEIYNDSMFDNILKTYNCKQTIDEDIKLVIDFILKKFDGYVNIRMLYKKKLIVYFVTDNLKLIDYFLGLDRECICIDKSKSLYSFRIEIDDLK